MPEQAGNEHYARGLARAAGGALLFAIPLLMTMEMWWLGFYMDRFRLALFLVVTLVILVRLSFYAGFEETFRFRNDAMDALASFAVGIVVSAIILAAFGVIAPDMPANEIFGKIALQAVPASIGAVLARKQLGGGGDTERRKRRGSGYGSELFLMMVGALFFAFNVAPTEEMVLIAYRMTHWHAAGLALLSVLLLHAFVYTVGFAGQEEPPGEAGFWLTFLHYTLAGYGIALIVSLYILWTFGRTDDVALAEIASMTLVLGFPAAVGAAVARLIT
jgi:putative integral membrane protein (TIGR02587 family)